MRLARASPLCERLSAVFASFSALAAVLAIWPMLGPPRAGTASAAVNSSAMITDRTSASRRIASPLADAEVLLVAARRRAVAVVVRAREEQPAARRADAAAVVAARIPEDVRLPDGDEAPAHALLDLHLHLPGLRRRRQ